MDEARSRETRARAELALVRLVHELRHEDVFLVVLGGLVPEVPARDDVPIPEHLGTTDVDVLLVTQVDPDADLGGVERALERIDFHSDANADGWRWRGQVGGAAVALEFLCDLRDQREHEIVRPRGCMELAAANLRGTGYVAGDFSWEQLSGKLADGTRVTVRVRFAGLEGYLLSKCVAARTRAATKDYYDLVYVLLHNRAGGPEQAAQRLLDGKLANALPALRTTFLELGARYARTTDSGPLGYADQALQVEPSPAGGVGKKGWKWRVFVLLRRFGWSQARLRTKQLVPRAMQRRPADRKVGAQRPTRNSLQAGTRAGGAFCSS